MRCQKQCPSTSHRKTLFGLHTLRHHRYPGRRVNLSEEFLLCLGCTLKESRVVVTNLAEKWPIPIPTGTPIKSRWPNGLARQITTWGCALWE